MNKLKQRVVAAVAGAGSVSGGGVASKTSGRVTTPQYLFTHSNALNP